MKTGTNSHGQQFYTGTLADMQAINDWARSLQHAVFGPIEGERRYRKLRFKDVLDLWCPRRVVAEA